MADNQESSLPFVVPKLCIKRVPVPQRSPRKQKLQSIDAATPQNAPYRHAEQTTSSDTSAGSSGGLKLVLRVPKESEALATAAAAAAGIKEEIAETEQMLEDSETSKDGQSDDHDTAVTISGGPTAADDLLDVERSGVDSPSATPSAATPGTAPDESSTAPKRRRKRRRFRLTTPSQKTKSKLWKHEGEQLERGDSCSPQRVKRGDQKKESRKKDYDPMEETGELTEETTTPTDARNEEQGTRFPSPPLQVLESFSPLQCLLDHLLRGFLKKDPESYFAFPVTEDIAPNYSTIITKPMDFLTIRQKIDASEYNSLQDFKEDIGLISSNATTYNQKNTVYYVAAKKLENVAEYMFSKEKLNAARKMLPQLAKLTPAHLGIRPAETDGAASKAKLGYYSCIVDDMCPAEIIEQVQSAAAAAREKLNSSHPNIEVLFGGDQADKAKSTTLKMLMPEHIQDKEAEENKDSSGQSSKRGQVILRDLVPKLKEGNPGLLKPDDSKDLVVPVTYLDYGPFSSFAPHYDSTWATLNKDESDLLLATFGGDEDCVRYIDSVRAFVRDTNDELSGILDHLIDLPEGLPSDAEPDVGKSTTAIADDSSQGSSSQHHSVVTTAHNGRISGPVQELLDKNAISIQELHTLQNQRLSAQPAFVLTRAPWPSETEVDTAAKVVSNLQQLASQVAPSQLVSAETVREALTEEGTNMDENDTSNEEYDMNVLREFFVVDNND